MDSYSSERRGTDGDFPYRERGRMPRNGRSGGGRPRERPRGGGRGGRVSSLDGGMPTGGDCDVIRTEIVYCVCVGG